MNSELLRRLGNIASIGTISEAIPAKALARVTLLDRVTDFLPVLMTANSFKRHFVPPRVGEQVVVVSPYGEANSGFIIRGIFNRGCREPALASGTTEVVEWEDGTVITYDTAKKELNINAVGAINIRAATTHTGNVTIIGNLEVVGNIHATGSIIDDGGNTNHHGH